MSDKQSGVDFDRQVFVQPESAAARPSPPLAGLAVAFIVIAVLFFLGYQLWLRPPAETATANPDLAELDKRLGAIEDRLTKLETTRRVAAVPKVEEPADASKTLPKPAAKTVFQISPAPAPSHATSAPAVDSATAQKISALQQNIGTIQDNQAANQQSWQATTDKLADMAGQVGTQGVEILKSQDELNQMLARTEMEAIPFELVRQSNPTPVGPVSLALMTSNTKAKHYTLCIYVDSSCVQLKDKTLFEVVQFVTSRNTAPMEVIATKITKDELLGYLEVPKHPFAH